MKNVKEDDGLDKMIRCVVSQYIIQNYLEDSFFLSNLFMDL